MGEFVWLTRFQGDAAGAFITVALPVLPEPGTFLLLQEAGGTAATFIGFDRPGVLEVNRQLDGAWQVPALLPLPVGGGASRLMLRIAADYIVLVLDEAPLGVHPLGVPAHRISGLGGSGIPSARVTAGASLPCDFAALTRRTVAALPREREGVSRALVITPHLCPAVADALGRCDEVVAVAPMPWHMAALTLAFADQIASGRLLPFAAAPGRLGRLRTVSARPRDATLIGSEIDPGDVPAQRIIEEVEVGSFLSALGAVAEIYHAMPGDQAGFDRMFEPYWNIGPRTSLVAPLAEAAALAALGCRRLSINRAWPTGRCQPRADRWISAPALRRLTMASTDHPTELVVVGSPRE